MYKTTEFRGTVREGIRFRDIQGEELYNFIKTELSSILQEKGIPFTLRDDCAKSGGFLGTKNPMMVINYPNPPTDFFQIGILVNGNLVSFPLLGESLQNTKYNKKKFLEEEGKFIRAAMINPDEFILQKELEWNRAIMDAFDLIIED